MGPMRWTLDAEHPLGSRPIRRFVWPNGLRLVLCCDPSAPIFSYQTWFRVGSSHEQPGRTGMAHFFEHLMFNETETMGPGVLDRLIEETGGENNAATWTDWTFYQTSLPAAELELAARIESERMQHLVLDDTQIESEREVVIHERLERVEDDVDGFLDERLYELAFTKHPYRWPTIGWMEDIRSLSKADIHDFYRHFYVPDRATIVVVGDVDEDAALATIDRYYGDIPAASRTDAAIAVEPEQNRERRRRYTQPVQAERVLIGYKVPGQGDPDWPVLEFVAAILCGGPSTRLYRRLVVERELATSVDAATMPFRDPSLLRIGVNLTRHHDTDAALTALDEVVAELCDRLVPESELDKIKNCVETDFWAALEDCDGRAEALGHYETTLGDFRRLFDIAERLAAVTAEDLRRVCRRYLRPEHRTVVTAAPGEQAEASPDRTEVEA